MDQPSVFDLCRKLANSHLFNDVGMNAEEYRHYCAEEALKLNADLPEPYPEATVRYTAESCASWARNNLFPAGSAKHQQKAMAARRNALSKGLSQIEAKEAGMKAWTQSAEKAERGRYPSPTRTKATRVQ